MPIVVQHLLDDCSQDYSLRTVKPGDFIYQPADVDTHVYIIEKGLVKIGSLGEWGQRVLYDLLKPGELFGDLDYLDEVVFFEYAQAATSASVYVIDRPAFRHAVTHNPLLADWFSETVIRRWHRTEIRLLHRNGLIVDDRIRHLQEQYNSSVLDANNQLHRPFDYLSYQEIGDLVGATRQTVSRKIRTSAEPTVTIVMHV
ncbi:Crp/Fnr family transcriptional regulator [Spirosoma oryzicola]|uniref:Crp/Fnr family transcriptional regulator n=1 Tax=Spirosoma oryzicola TaxID=2898794 RepID=UPI001E554DFD|nr:Crp/Fnr family transcriptional regulator [Spirosoma oryzicola]UHG94149.1 Crp/Fnr family transcriptional regulator [Spirosoma oryzicola]